MAAQSTSVSRMDASRVLLATVDLLAREFPDVPLPTIYEKVGEARESAAHHLPDVDAYGLAIERAARVQLALMPPTTGAWGEVSAGTSGLHPLQ